MQTKSDILNRIKAKHIEFRSRENDASGDEADLTNSILDEQRFLDEQNRMRYQLLEIEAALGRIEQGCYGICEETEQPIEVKRLKVIPWTRLSIEGAETQEAIKKRFARG